MKVEEMIFDRLIPWVTSSYLVHGSGEIEYLYKIYMAVSRMGHGTDSHLRFLHALLYALLIYSVI